MDADGASVLASGATQEPHPCTLSLKVHAEEHSFIAGLPACPILSCLEPCRRHDDPEPRRAQRRCARWAPLGGASCGNQERRRCSGGQACGAGPVGVRAGAQVGGGEPGERALGEPACPVPGMFGRTRLPRAQHAGACCFPARHDKPAAKAHEVRPGSSCMLASFRSIPGSSSGRNVLRPCWSWSCPLQLGNREIVIDQTEPKQTVYIFNCSASTIQVCALPCRGLQQCRRRKRLRQQV